MLLNDVMGFLLLTFVTFLEAQSFQEGSLRLSHQKTLQAIGNETKQ
jgi:hypothetical protein